MTTQFAADDTATRDGRAAQGEPARAEPVSANMPGILDTIDVPIVVVARDRKIERFNRAATEVLGLTPSDIGRLSCNIRALAELKGFEKLCAQVIADGAPCRRDVRVGDQWFVLRIAPGVGSDHEVGGAVLTFVNVTALRVSIAQAIQDREYTKTILNTVTDALVVLDRDLRVQTANRAFYAMFGVSREQVHGVRLCDLGNEQWKTCPLWPSLKSTRLDNGGFQSLEIEREFPGIGRRTVLLDARRLSDDSAAMMLLAFHDITERKRARDQLNTLHEQVAADLRAMTDLYQVGSRCVQSGAEFDACLGEILEAAIDVTGASKGTLQLFDRSTAALRLTAHRGFGERFLNFFDTVLDEASTCGTAMNCCERIVVEDVTRSPIFAGTPSLDVLLEEAVRAVQSTPLISSTGQLLGMISTHFAQPRQVAERELRLMDLLARQAADFVERCQADQALRKNRAWLAAQKQALQASIGGAALEESLAGLVGAATEYFGEDTRAGVYLASDDGKALHHVVGMPNEYAKDIDGFEVGAHSLACGLATYTGQPVLTADVKQEPRWRQWLWVAEKFDYRACWSFPLNTSQRQLLGTFAVYWRRPREAKPSDIAFAGTITDTAAIIIARHTEAEARKLAEQSLRASEQRFRMIADNMAQLAWTCDTLGNVTWYNQRWLEYTGLSFEETRGWNWSKVQHPDHLNRVVATVRRSAETGEPWEDTFPLRGKDGRYRWFLSQAVPIRDEGGQIVQWFGTNTDVTEQRNFQREREAMLVNEQSLRREAEAANRTKDMFLATLSHEMRTPLASMVGWIGILKPLIHRFDDPDLREGLEVIERNTKAQEQLIADVLDVSRIVSGKLELQISECDLADMVRGALDSVRHAAAAKQIAVKVDLDPSLIHFACDPARMQQVVWNLLSNAIKFTPRNGNISVSARRHESIARIEVTDCGVGITPEFLPLIFSRFAQADSSTRRKFGGLGLGLSIVKQLVEMHGGTVRVTSEGKDKGATFTIDLPISAVRLPQGRSDGVERGGQDNDAAGESGTRAPSGRPGSPGRLDGLRILLVDDEPDARRVLGKILTDAGAAVTAAGSARAALEALEKMISNPPAAHPPHVLVSDIGMPEVDGYDLLRAVRAKGYDARQLPAVAVTAFASKQFSRAALEAGFQVHAAKPINPHDLVLAVARLGGCTPAAP